MWAKFISCDYSTQTFLAIGLKLLQLSTWASDPLILLFLSKQEGVHRAAVRLVSSLCLKTLLTISFDKPYIFLNLCATKFVFCSNILASRSRLCSFWASKRQPFGVSHIAAEFSAWNAHINLKTVQYDNYCLHEQPSNLHAFWSNHSKVVVI